MSNQPATNKPTSKQQNYLRKLAQRTGTSFTPPKTRGQASREIQRLLTLKQDSYRDIRREHNTVSGDLHTGTGDSARHRPDEVTGYGSNARWNHS